MRMELCGTPRSLLTLKQHCKNANDAATALVYTHRPSVAMHNTEDSKWKQPVKKLQETVARGPEVERNTQRIKRSGKVPAKNKWNCTSCNMKQKQENKPL